jgi:hypothetical protein
VINYERPTRPAEEFAEPDSPPRRIPKVEILRPLFKCIVLENRTFWEMAPQLRNAFPLTHELDLG